MKKFVLFLFLIFSFLFSFSQNKKFISHSDFDVTLKHAKNLSSVFSNLGYTHKGYCFELGYSLYLSNEFLFDVSFNYNSKTINFTNGKDYLLNPSINYKIISLFDNSIFFHIGLGFGLGFQNLSCSVNEDKFSKFIYFPELCLKNEIYVSQNFILNLNFSQTLFSNSEFDKQYYKILFGVKYLIY